MERIKNETAVVTEEKNGNGNTHTPIYEETKPVDAAAVPSTSPYPPFQKPTLEDLKGALKEHKRGIGIAAAVLLITAGYLIVKGRHGPAAPANAAVPVVVQTITSQKVRLWSDFSARLQAVDYAEIRPEVSGRITEIRFEDGQRVRKGDVLFVIDPAPYRAALVKAEASAEFAKTELDRADGLVKAQAIAQRLFDERATSSRVAEADLARARIDYDRAYVKAPISGRIGRPEITVGNLLNTSPNAPLLTTIVSSNGIYADFEVDEQTYLQSIRDHANGRDEERAIPVELTVKGDKDVVYKGSIYSFDNHIDRVSGTIRARAKFDNKDGALLPGMFVSIKMGSSGEHDVLLVPERSLGVDQNKKFLYVVGKDNKVSYREVTLGKQVGNDRVVLSGAQPGDRVIVDGLQHVRPDAIVDPKETAALQTPPADPVAAAR